MKDTAMTPNVLESAILRACLEYLDAVRVFAWRNSTGAVKYGQGPAARFVRFGKIGASDIIGALPDGRFLAVECKTARGRLSPEQIAFLGQVKRAGGVAIVARSVDDLIIGLESAGFATGELFGRRECASQKSEATASRASKRKISSI